MFSSFQKRYILALLFIAILSILAYLNLKYLTELQVNDGETINISGKQRMLSQKIALYVLQDNIPELEKSFNSMEVAHKHLISMNMSQDLKNVYFKKPIELDKEVKTYIYHANLYAKSKDVRSLNYILDESKYLLKDLDHVTTMYQNESDKRVDNLKENEFYILVVTLLTIIFEALFIFRPADKSIILKRQELQRQSEYLDLITQINTNAIIAVDSKFNILTFNKSAEKMFGYSAEEMLNTKLTDDRIIPAKYLSKHNRGLKDFVINGGLKHRDAVFELEGQKKDKTIFPIRISFGIKVEDKVRIVVANIQNISDEKEKDRLIVQQSRLAAMGEMIGNIAHQWRQPLSSISTIATGTKLRYKNGMISDEELDEVFVKIKNHTVYLSKTIDDFRNFLNDDVSKEEFSLSSVLNKSLTFIEATYSANKIELILNLDSDDIKIYGSSSQLSQVILNILNNAKDALVENGVESRVVYIETLENAQRGCVKIYDNAGGIKAEVSEKIYEPYFTTKHKSEGTGIGLFMSQKIIQQHFKGVLSNKNVSFRANGKDHFGACFTISLNLV
jgi:PAS domain S-box-containing protein